MPAHEDQVVADDDNLMEEDDGEAGPLTS